MNQGGFIDSEPLSVGAGLRRTLSLLRRNPARVGVALVVLTFMGVATDWNAGREGEGIFTLGTSIVSLAFQYWLTRSLLDDLGLLLSPRPRFAAFFGLGLLSTVAILAGLVLLIVPGIILLTRWVVSGPILIAGEASVTESLGRSWHVTQGHFLPIFVIYFTIYAAAFLGIVAVSVLAALEPTMNMAASVGFNFLINGGLIAGWHAAVAIYIFLVDRGEVAEVFA